MPRDRGSDRDYYSYRRYSREIDSGLGGLARRIGDKMVLQGNALARGAFLGFGPTVPEKRPDDEKLQGEKWVLESDDREHLYKHVKNIGVGGQGQCDLYRKSGYNKFVVCKTMKRGFERAFDRKGRRVPAEAIILRDILGPHPLICNLQAFTNDTFWFEYCGLGDLQDLCSSYVEHNTRVPESFIWHSYRQLAEALAFIH
ncbi:MAG: hypothetical protein Q9169_008181, partial [Polycauliona sp. 2 TL-2023]